MKRNRYNPDIHIKRAQHISIYSKEQSNEYWEYIYIYIYIYI